MEMLPSKAMVYYGTCLSTHGNKIKLAVTGSKMAPLLYRHDRQSGAKLSDLLLEECS